MIQLKIICISGKARSGKDTSAEYLRRIFWGDGKRVLIIHNADLLKYMCEKLFGWDGQKDERGRSLLQYVGTDVVRAKNPDFWVEFIAKVLMMFPDRWDYVIIPDVRFPNEIAYLRGAGYECVHLRVYRSAEDNMTQEQRAHPSETAMDDYEVDVAINNDGSIADLCRQLLSFKTQYYGGADGY